MQLPRVLRRLWSMLRPARVDREMCVEMSTHLELQTAQNLAAGMSPEEARFAARRQFGGVAQIQERARAQRFGVGLEHWAKDFKLAVRALRKAPGFTLAVLMTLALCIGPNTAVLSVLYALVWKPLPVPAAHELFVVRNVAAKNGSHAPGTYQQYLDFNGHADRFAGFALLSPINSTVGEESEPERATGFRVTTEFFALFGLTPLHGRFFHAEEQAAGRDRVLVLSHRFWTRKYAADPAVIGREIRMGGEAFTIVGVAPARFEQIYTTVDFFKPHDAMPFELQPQQRYQVRRDSFLFGRVKPGVSIEAGLAQLGVLEGRFYRDVAEAAARQMVDKTGMQLSATPLRETLASAVRSPLVLLQCGALLVLLIGCSNVVNLLLARANARRPEFAVRHALGASKGALWRHMLLESLVLSATATVLGVALAVGGLQLINHYLPLITRGMPPVELDLRVLLVTTLTALGLGALTGTLPFLLVWKGGLQLDRVRHQSAARGSRRVSASLVVAQVALALTLLVGATLLMRSLAQVLAVDPGFDATQVVQGRVAVGGKSYQGAAENVALQERIRTAFSGIPGVDRAAIVADFGVTASYRQFPFILRRLVAETGTKQTWGRLAAVSSDYFATMGIRILEGRDFNAEDNYSTSRCVIVDQAFAARYFPAGDAIGQEIVTGGEVPKEGEPWARIVGVAARAQLAGLEQRDGMPFVYVPTNGRPGPGFSFLLRTQRSAAEVLPEMRKRLRAIDPALPLYAAGSLQTALDDMLLNRRAILVLLAVFAGLALLMAGVGLYGVLAYDVSQRTRELGVRAAIGASRGQLIGLILRQGIRRVVIGLAIGLAGAFYLSRHLRSQLFDVTAADPASYATVCLVLLIVALLASWLPARRAAKVDPMIALRAE